MKEMNPISNEEVRSCAMALRKSLVAHKMEVGSLDTSTALLAALVIASDAAQQRNLTLMTFEELSTQIYSQFKKHFEATDKA